MSMPKNQSNDASPRQTLSDQAIETALLSKGETHTGEIVWILDTGATSNVVCDKRAIRKLNRHARTQFATANGATMSEGMGKVHMETKEGAQISFDDCSLLRSVGANLLSYSQLLNKGWKFDLQKTGGQLREAI